MTHWPDTRLCTLLDIEHPIIQAPMAGATTPEMASVVSNAGGLGSLGCAIMKPEAVLSSVSKTRNLSNRALNLNFFCHESPVLNAGLSVAAQERLQPWFDDMNIEHMPDAIEGHFPFDAEMCQIVIEASPKVVSFHFGLPDTKLVKRIKDAGIKVLSSATSVAEAQWLQTHGADAVIAQGYEAGGHNGWFLPRAGGEVAGTMALVPRIVDAVDCPVIAAGGIGSGQQMAAALALGAEGVWCGSIWLTVAEAATSNPQKERMFEAGSSDTVRSKSFTGKPVRMLRNKWTDAWDSADNPDPLGAPMQGMLTSEATTRMRQYPSKSQDITFSPVGQIVGTMNETISARDLVMELVTGYLDSAERLTSLLPKS